MAVIGRTEAVADLFGKVRVGGFPAFLIWGVIHLAYLVGWGNRFEAVTPLAVDDPRPQPARAADQHEQPGRRRGGARRTSSRAGSPRSGRLRASVG